MASQPDGVTGSNLEDMSKKRKGAGIEPAPVGVRRPISLALIVFLLGMQMTTPHHFDESSMSDY
jgi:hypothetical protein